ncbi:glioma pathogenesis-related protein 1 [Phascolarctos cinereus]|uniref:Glioma pathogenesis-related protein 1 n=1 Tax=Phascolarctos cinereus TaxID=38626 RepID=A0A6P5IQX8_PHACI|nr:glioma pathogenesis-related protein 1 [Phascolarctos cinereus]
MAMDSWLGIIIFSVFSVCSWAYKMDTLPNIENEAFIKECLDIHNKFRSQVNPKASNMLRMSWDTELAKTAKAWAKKCQFAHNVDLTNPKKLHPTFSSVGENIWVGSIGAFSEESAIKMWNDEVKNYNFQTQKCTHVCGHYTQVVWANSYKVGCAVQFCPKLTGTPISNGALFVCNYGPAGNYVYMRPYEEGKPCSACKEDTCINQLCANPNRDGDIDKQHVEEAGTRQRSVSLVLILVPLLIILSIILAILIKHYYPR